MDIVDYLIVAGAGLLGVGLAGAAATNRVTPEALNALAVSDTTTSTKEGLSAEELAHWASEVAFANTSIVVQADVIGPLTVAVLLSDFIDEGGNNANNIQAIAAFEAGIKQRGWHIAKQPSFDEGEAGYMLHKDACLPARVPPHVYHVTRENRVASILRNGLKLSRGGSHGFRYPPRVFFAISPEVALEMGQQELGGSAVLEIDTTKVPDFTLCVDPEFDPSPDDWIAAYSERSIPPHAITRFY